MPGEMVLVIDDSPTILKVVQLVLTKAGFHVRTALDGEQGVELAREKRPDLILLDFVMPKMNGYQVCRTLTDDQALKDVPVVLMSAKGDQVGERFVKVMGIVDYITKPFSPDAITAVVTHTIAKYAKAPDDAAGLVAELAALAPVQPAAPQVTLSASGSQAIIDGSTADAKQALETLRQSIAHAVAARLAENGQAGEVAQRAASALSDDALESMVATLRNASPELLTSPDIVLSGDVRVVPLAEVLQLLHQQAQSGALGISRPGSRVDVYFRAGRVDLATQAGISDEFLIGRFVLEQNLMSKQDLDLLLASRQEGAGWLLGRQLVKLGYISDTDLKQIISKQTCEIIYEVLRWNFGRFAFRTTKELPAIAVEAALALSVEGILMEGFRRVDEWHLIEREIDNFDVVFLRNEDALTQIGRGRLTREELAVLELVNGKNTVKEIIRLSRMGSFDVTKMLYRLLSIKVLRRREMPVAV